VFSTSDGRFPGRSPARTARDRPITPKPSWRPSLPRALFVAVKVCHDRFAEYGQPHRRWHSAFSDALDLTPGSARGLNHHDTFEVAKHHLSRSDVAVKPIDHRRPVRNRVVRLCDLIFNDLQNSKIQWREFPDRIQTEQFMIYSRVVDEPTPDDRSIRRTLRPKRFIAVGCPRSAGLRNEVAEVRPSTQFRE
jgi:hypothetical protein